MKRNQRWLIIGSGAREHVLHYLISQSPLVSRVYVAPGNGGIPEVDRIDVNELDFSELLKTIRMHNIDCVMVGPEAPLLHQGGIVNFLEKHAPGVLVVGPTDEMAKLEGSKLYAKQLCTDLGIPTAEYRVATSPIEAEQILSEWGVPIVIKADGLCGGKGVIVAKSMTSARLAIDDLMVKRIYKESGDTVIFERMLEGRECSLIMFCDGDDVIAMPPARDYKRILEGDMGPNTGGMASYSPLEDVNQEKVDQILGNIAFPIVQATGYRGILYIGLMLTAEGPKVIEFNCRFGDPEIQSMAVRLKSDIVPYLLATCKRFGLKGMPDLEVSDQMAVCVVMAAEGYPKMPILGRQLDARLIVENADGVDPANRLFVFYAGVKQMGSRYIVSGGRVLSVVALANTLEEARKEAYFLIDNCIPTTGLQFRRDIALLSK